MNSIKYKKHKKVNITQPKSLKDMAELYTFATLYDINYNASGFAKSTLSVNILDLLKSSSEPSKTISISKKHTKLPDSRKNYKDVTGDKDKKSLTSNNIKPTIKASNIDVNNIPGALNISPKSFELTSKNKSNKKDVTVFTATSGVPSFEKDKNTLNTKAPIIPPTIFPTIISTNKKENKPIVINNTINITSNKKDTCSKSKAKNVLSYSITKANQLYANYYSMSNCTNYIAKMIPIKHEPILVGSWVKWNPYNYSITKLNWGDDLNFYFLQDITKKYFVPYIGKNLVNNPFINKEKSTRINNYLLIGSVINKNFMNANTIIWGAGIMAEDKELGNKVKEVKAVRGPLTRKMLLSKGIKCPEVYGDPALLLPYYYNPALHKKYKLGIIPHHKSLSNPILQNFNDTNVIIIDLVNYTNWTDVIDKILSCEFIASESLHGLIVSEAYKIPNLWIQIQLDDQEMKFHDFFLSIGEDRKSPYIINNDTTKFDLLELLKNYKASKKINVGPLIKACPFKLSNISYPANIKTATEKIAICAIAKMENNYIREWVEYHKNIGVDNIILYDNNDIDGERFEDVIGDYIESGYVILKDYRGEFQALIRSYTECYKEYQNKYDWLAFIDIDEFIEMDERFSNIHTFLNQKKFNIRGINAVRLCWKLFTDNNIIEVKNNNYSIKRFTLYRPLSEKWTSDTTKIILRTSLKDVEFSSPHGPLLDNRIKCVNTKGAPCENAIAITAKTWENARLNHYRFRTIHEYVMNKMVRLWPTHYCDGGKSKLNLEFFFKFNTYTKKKYDYAMDLIKKYNISENKG